MTLAQLKTWIKTSLGDNVINVEISDLQLTDRIDEAVARFIESHCDGVDQGIIYVNTVVGQMDYTLASNVQAVTHVFPSSDVFIADEKILIEPVMYQGKSYYNSVDLVGYETFRQQLEMVQDYFMSEPLHDFNTTTKKFHLMVAPIEVKELALHVYLSESTLDNIYGNTWLKKYAKSLCGIQWALNISKYGGVPLIGGGTLNGEVLLSHYKEERDKLEEELEMRYSEPVDFFVG
jgi:hypothetical protein